MTTVGVIEDDNEIREGLERFFRSQDDIACGLAEDSVEKFMARVDMDSPPEVVIMDIGLPGMSGIRGIRFLKERMPDTDFIMFTVYDDPNKIFQSLCAGATGYLLKTDPFVKIKEAIETLREGGAPMSPQIGRKVVEFFSSKKPISQPSPLTDKEREVVVGIVDGLSYKMIADRLRITIGTVRHHIKNIYRKLQVNSKAEVISKSFQGEI